MIALSEYPPSKESFQKVKPLCPVFGECGGCTFQDISYQQELSIKETRIDELCRSLQLSSGVLRPILSSPQEYHYRHRIDLKLKRGRDQIRIGFSPHAGKGVVEIDQCWIAQEAVSKNITRVKDEALQKLPLKYRMASLVVKGGDDERVHWGGIGKRSTRLNEQDYLWTDILNKKVFYSLDTFFQANLSILPPFFDEIRSWDIWGNDKVLYDLYGGVGLFSIMLSDVVGSMCLIEENPASITLAQYNKDYHRLDNMTILTGRVEDHLSQLAQIKTGNIGIIDPPRAGLSENSLKFFSSSEQFEHLIYLSCNPDALVKDLEVFQGRGWQIEKMIPCDFFPKTKHIETLVLLKPKLCIGNEKSSVSPSQNDACKRWV